MSQTFIFMFNDLHSYDKHKADVIANGGTIKHDLGTVLLGFTAIIPPTLVETIAERGNFEDNGIASFEPDSVVNVNLA